MADMGGTGDGDGGKQIWVMGTPVDGGGGGRVAGAVTIEDETGSAVTVDVARADGVDTANISEKSGAEAGNVGMPL
jgi:hypothetical protein